MWGIWWTWDVRLTSTLVLWLIYISYLMLRRFSTSAQTPVLAAALAIFGALKGRLVGTGWLRSALQTITIGGAAAAAAYTLARLLNSHPS